ncbi:DUF6261 family protein [Streptococcus cuniculipharyngis]|uniref:Uncharacterized protein n=1 Tax=Streptococcus cuniculipharyngis TaxID=1562651 RepID=A0A5C5S9W8_9STRE|nr:DUF6261 family protein [Streptococcus cuniculipharyngis]TWS96893.1 hypothetical protein FRX57_06350 [Streptococcus cuniculipharyngis]
MKKVYRVTGMSPAALDSKALYQLIKESHDAIAKFTKAHKTELLYVSKNTRLSTLLDQFDDGLHVNRSSRVTKKLEAADNERKDALVTLFSLIRAFARSKDSNSQAAYQDLTPLLKNYQKLTQLSYEKRTESINHLLAQLASVTYQSALTQFHLSPHVEQLKAVQNRFARLYQERLTEQTSFVPSQNRQLKVELIETYEFLVDFTALNAYAYPEKAYFAQLRDQLNAIRSRYRKRKGKKAPTVIADLAVTTTSNQAEVI